MTGTWWDLFRDVSTRKWHKSIRSQKVTTLCVTGLSLEALSVTDGVRCVICRVTTWNAVLAVCNDANISTIERGVRIWSGSRDRGTACRRPNQVNLSRSIFVPKINVQNEHRVINIATGVVKLCQCIEKSRKSRYNKHTCSQLPCQ